MQRKQPLNVKLEHPLPVLDPLARLAMTLCIDECEKPFILAASRNWPSLIRHQLTQYMYDNHCREVWAQQSAEMRASYEAAARQMLSVPEQCRVHLP